MQITLETKPLEAIECDGLAVVVFEGQKNGLPEAARELYESKEFTGKPLELALIHRPVGLAARRLLLVGGGKEEKFTTSDLRRAAGAAVRHLKGKSLKNVALAVGSGDVAAAVEGALLGHYEPDGLKTDKNGVKAIDWLILAGAGDEAALRRGQIIADAQNFARALVNEPSNRLSPGLLADHARRMAAEAGLDCEVLDQDRMKQLGMGALLGVAMGSAEPPALIVLRYRPAGESKTHLGIVGKGVTFDSGGLSIKPADGMEKMKYDMAGGAAAIAAMKALAELRPRIAVTALIPAVENMTGSRAQRPGDIVTSLSGKTIEVLNTDAEGRLILADAITYAKSLGCTHLVDAATLTGAIVVALGHIHVGLFASDDEMRKRVMDAAAAEGEKVWHMPLDDDYKDYLKSAFADLPNIGGRWGGSITAAIFLKEFAAPAPWVHLDIAGTAWLDDAKPYLAKGATGVCVRTFIRLATEW
ncbi:MAG: leucyl aminopeptidase [Bryobacteraceae bacterium]